jgi:hypothetical protein
VKKSGHKEGKNKGAKWNNSKKKEFKKEECEE